MCHEDKTACAIWAGCSPSHCEDADPGHATRKKRQTTDSDKRAMMERPVAKSCRVETLEVCPIKPAYLMRRKPIPESKLGLRNMFVKRKKFKNLTLTRFYNLILSSTGVKVAEVKDIRLTLGEFSAEMEDKTSEAFRNAEKEVCGLVSIKKDIPTIVIASLHTFWIFFLHFRLGRA